jgi:hypothetical protein
MGADDRTPKPDVRRGFFANALRHAGRKPTPERLGSHVLRCPGCGAPRQRDDLTCRFCGGKTTE